MKRLYIACLTILLCLAFADTALAKNDTAPPTAKAAPIEKTIFITPVEKASIEKTISITPVEKAPTEKAASTKPTEATPVEKAPAINPVAEALKARDPIRIALITSGSINDLAWTQAMYEGLKIMQAYRGEDALEFSVSEHLTKPAAATTAIRKYASENYDLIIAHSAQYQKLLSTIAPKFPSTSFAYGSGTTTVHPNIFAYAPQAEEGAYLLGMLAGFTTKSNIIGIVGSVEKGDALKFNQGFTMGVKATNPDAKVLITYTGSSSNHAKAGEIAKAHIWSGADILSGSAQQAVGAIKAASEFKDIVWLGSTLSLSQIAPKTVLATQIYNFAAVINEMLENRKRNILGGKTIPLSLANGYEYIKYNKAIRSDYMRKIDAAKAAIIDGSLIIDPTKKADAKEQADIGKQAKTEAAKATITAEALKDDTSKVVKAKEQTETGKQESPKKPKPTD